MPRLTTDFNGILTGEQLGHIHGENEPYRYSFGSHKGHYINVVKRGLREVPHSDISSTSLIATETRSEKSALRPASEDGGAPDGGCVFFAVVHGKRLDQ